MNEKLLNSLPIDKLRYYLVCQIEYSNILRERIDKAIEYIENSTEFDYVILEKTLDILRGEND